MPDARKLFEALVREHAPMLTAYLRAALGDTPDVDDVFQETMIVAWRRLDDFDQTRPFGQWLRGIAKRLLLAHHRQRRRRPCDSATLDHLDGRMGQLAACTGDTWEDKLEALRSCIQTLPEPYLQVIRLRYFQRLAIRQVSEMAALSDAAVKKRLQRARERILGCLQTKIPSAEAS